MASATYLLLLVGVLGALDIAVYHTRAHDLRRQPSAWHELITHSLRGPTYAILFVVVPNFAAHGAWFVVMLALFVFDIAISLWDFAVERKSRMPMGGLPTGEYVLHSIIAMLFGAFVACYCIAGWPWLELETAWVRQPAVPTTVQALLAVMSIGVLWSGIADARAVVRLRRTVS
ncbi:MAG: hypothetical protein KDC95_05570 [Planctomycetes bacterium]|nr:hypothetical protein [Planctomycetota bacterium]